MHRIMTKFFGVFLLCVLIVYGLFFSYQQQQLSDDIIAHPQINDFYYLDFRQISDDLRPHENYRIAKVIDITGDIVTLQYGSFFYRSKAGIPKAIGQGHVRNTSYFEAKKYDFTSQEILTLRDENTIYQAERAIGNMMHGNFITSAKRTVLSKTYYPGARQNQQGLAFQASSYIEEHQQKALALFLQSAELGYMQGQVNVAEMYLEGRAGNKDITKALYWFEQAALQSYRPAIDKYIIVCRQQASCDINVFYQLLRDNGINFRLNSSKLITH